MGCLIRRLLKSSHLSTSGRRGRLLNLLSSGPSITEQVPESVRLIIEMGS